MEENNAVEQPEDSVNVCEQIEEKEDNLNSGSTLGKFKDATSLLNAYTNLEKEFTRKSQKLKDISKELEDVKMQNLAKNGENQVQNGEVSKGFVAEENKLKPQFLDKSWKGKVSQFLKQNPDAQPYKSKIAQTLLSNKQLATLEDCLNLAYLIAKSGDRPADLSDPRTISELANNENIKNEVIKNYLLSLKNNPTNIRLISGQPNIVSPSAPKSKPKDLKEASSMLKKLLQM